MTSSQNDTIKRRFTIGETYYFCQTSFNKTNSNISSYEPWDDELIDIDVIALTCTEHHKVSDGYVDALNHDGFVFERDNGEVWHNQYPTACYGQLDDSSDRYVHYHHGSDEIDSLAWSERHQIGREYVLATHVINRQVQALNPHSRFSYVGEMENASAVMDGINKYQDLLVFELEQTSGKKVNISNVIYNERVIKSVTCVTLV